MDYQKLKLILPKQPIKWNTEDISVWLKFIGLENLNPIFQSTAIDGSCLSILTQEDLKNELNIKSGIIVKKLMAWIRIGMKEYQQFLKKQTQVICNQFDYYQEQLNPIVHLTKNFSHSSSKEKKSFKNTYKIQQQKISSLYVPPQKQTLQKQTNEEKQINQREKIQLIIQQCDGPQTSFYTLKQQGGKIGRHSSNQILILQQSISRYHAQILFQDGEFYLKDVGSTTGTFIKIIQKIEVFEGMIIQMGSNQFVIEKLQGNTVKFTVVQGPNIHQQIQIVLKKGGKINFGRKLTNQVHFPDDQHLSNIHASFFMIQNNYILQDLATTNGSWKRLSLQGLPSQKYILKDKTIFKIGTNLTYVCKINSASKAVQQKVTPNVCAICYENDKDCVYMPCKHNAACIRCSKNLKQCPICRNKIQDFLKIYRS